MERIELEMRDAKPGRFFFMGFGFGLREGVNILGGRGGGGSSRTIWGVGEDSGLSSKSISRQ